MRTLPDVERVEAMIPRAEVEDAVHEQGRRLHRAGLVAPEDLAPVEEDVALLRTEEDRDDESLLRARKPVTGIRLHVGLVDDVLSERRRGSSAGVEVRAPLP